MYKAVLDASALNILLDNAPGADNLRQIANEAAISELTLTQALIDLKVSFPLDDGLIHRVSFLVKDVLPCSNSFTTHALVTLSSCEIGSMESLAAIALAREFRVPLYTRNLELSEKKIQDIEIKYVR